MPSGCREVSGRFQRGDCISIVDEEGKEIARGLTNYSAKEVFIILGRNTKDIPRLLGYVRKPEIIHRNDMVVHL